MLSFFLVNHEKELGRFVVKVLGLLDHPFFLRRIILHAVSD
jgi:hypothetical protein